MKLAVFNTHYQFIHCYPRTATLPVQPQPAFVLWNIDVELVTVPTADAVSCIIGYKVVAPQILSLFMNPCSIAINIFIYIYCFLIDPTIDQVSQIGMLEIPHCPWFLLVKSPISHGFYTKWCPLSYKLAYHPYFCIDISTINHSAIVKLKFQLVGLREKLQETPIFPGKIYGFLYIFPWTNQLKVTFTNWTRSFPGASPWRSNHQKIPHGRA